MDALLKHVLCDGLRGKHDLSEILLKLTSKQSYSLGYLKNIKVYFWCQPKVQVSKKSKGKVSFNDLR
ncbi:MAG: hypothetical protein COA50_10305 [Flavobacteriaceae bacterium]|nr:MAG: hypothetical protein COA50_10305 [Flavobacteriaceae bacterium]